MPSLRPTLLLAGLCLIFGAGCGSEEPTSEAEFPAAELAQTESIQAALAAHKGKPVILNFWALW